MTHPAVQDFIRRLRLLLIDYRLPRLVIGTLFVAGVTGYIALIEFAPAALAPDTDQITNVTWTSTSVSFDYQPAKDCPSLTFHSSYRDASNDELGADDTVNGNGKSAGVKYRETIHGAHVPAGTSRIVITARCTGPTSQR